VGGKQDPEPLGPPVLIRHVRRFFLVRSKADGLIQGKSSVNDLWSPNDALCVLALVLHESLLCLEVL